MENLLTIKKKTVEIMQKLLSSQVVDINLLHRSMSKGRQHINE